MSVKVTTANGAGDYLTFGSANTPTAAQIGGYDDGSSAGHMEFYTTTAGTSTERMRIDQYGNVGIGTSSPAYKLQSNAGSANNNNEANTIVATGTNHVRIKVNTPTTGGYRASLILSSDEAVSGTANEVGLSTTGAKELQFATNGSERMRIDASGNVLIGTTSNPGSGDFKTVIDFGGNGRALALRTTLTTSRTMQSFFNGNGEVGHIDTSGSTTSYVTSSDYRLKENINPIENALDKVAQLKPVTYTWKVDGTDGEGFIAHELAEVCPQAVSGEKDAVDEEGNPIYQGIDTSFLVATLTAALQEAHGLIKDLTTRIETLETK